MTRRSVVVGLSFLIAGTLTGCAKPPAAEPPAPATATTFANALTAAEARAEAGDYVGADRILADFALKEKGTPEAQEVAFWRAMYMVDPNNKGASMAEAVRALDIYLATPGVKWYRAHAQVLRRTAMSVQALRTQQPIRLAAGRDTVFITREEEIAALRDQLAKANAELERIKKRLADPGR